MDHIYDVHIYLVALEELKFIAGIDKINKRILSPRLCDFMSEYKETCNSLYSDKQKRFHRRLPYGGKV